jgi:RNA-binding protein 8A
LVTNVHEELTEEDLIELFSEYGPLKNIHLNLDRRTGYVKVCAVLKQGYALIEYSGYNEAKDAIKHLDGYVLQSRRLKCDFAFVRGGSQPTRPSNRR